MDIIGDSSVADRARTVGLLRLSIGLSIRRLLLGSCWSQSSFIAEDLFHLRSAFSGSSVPSRGHRSSSALVTALLFRMTDLSAGQSRRKILAISSMLLMLNDGPLLTRKWLTFVDDKKGERVVSSNEN